MKTRAYLILLGVIAGLGGLLYGYDLGIIGTALLYLDKCVRLSEQQVGLLASAVMVGALASSLIGGGFSDWLGRKRAMIVSALLFAASVLMIIAAKGFWPLFFGRTLQGLSAGMIAVVIPVFLSECVPAKTRGIGSTIFQLCITLGILLAMAAGAYYQAGMKSAVEAAAGDAAKILAVEDQAWRNMFRSSIWPAMAFLVVAMWVSESPRWLYRRGRKEKALEALLKGRERGQAEVEMREMEEVTGAAKERRAAGGDPLFQRHYIMPLLLAVTLLGINQATGIVAVFTFPVVMLHQSGLSESAASHAGVWLALTNFAVTIAGVLLVDRLGRKALLMIGTGIIIIALTAGVLTFAKLDTGREETGRVIFGALLLYIVGFAFGPGVCLWVMSAELLPTRVRSIGMGLGVLFNALVSIVTTSVFLPVVGNFGYAAMWGGWLACTVVYFLFAAFVLPETKGRTLEEIEAGFIRHRPGMKET